MPVSQPSPKNSTKRRRLWRRGSILTIPPRRTTADVWAFENRVYPAHADRPGAREPQITPYVIDFERAFDDTRYPTCVFVCGSQMGKTETILDVIGHRFHQRPTPQMYIGPTQDFIVDEFEPRLMRLIDEAKPLSQIMTRGKKNKRFRKVLGGVPIRLAWAGSPTQMSGTSAGLVFIDEYDRMMKEVGNEGDPLGLAKGRALSFRDRKYGVVSTPLTGNVESFRDPKSGLEFWKRMPAEDVESPVWKLYQQGTMYHWAWPCPHCAEFFIPRFKQLMFNGRTPSEARERAYIECPRCHGHIIEAHKPEMNKRGVYVAPGQSIRQDGTVVGCPADSTIFSCWASGLASPFVTIGERASEYLEAKESADPARLQTCINTGFGEIYSRGGGDAPETAEVSALRQVYKIGDLPAGSVFLTCALDVQTDGIYYVTRSWGTKASSWLVDRGFLIGDTMLTDVWDAAADLITTPIHGHVLKKVIIDSGFRPGRVAALPTNRVYEFCRRFPRLVSPAKGRATQSVPVRKSKIDVTPKGAVKKSSLELLLLDTDWFKLWIHEKIRWPQDKPGFWLLPDNIGDDYCSQIVSESRVKKPSGQVTWVARSRANHYLDCESMNAAAAHLLNAVRIRDGRGTRATMVGEDDIVSEIAEDVAISDRAAGGDGAEPSIRIEKPAPQVVVPRRRSFSELSAMLNR